jgi:hypothetical protein
VGLLDGDCLQGGPKPATGSEGLCKVMIAFMNPDGVAPPFPSRLSYCSVPTVMLDFKVVTRE